MYQVDWQIIVTSSAITPREANECTDLLSSVEEKYPFYPPERGAEPAAEVNHCPMRVYVIALDCKRL